MNKYIFEFDKEVENNGFFVVAVKDRIAPEVYKSVFNIIKDGEECGSIRVETMYLEDGRAVVDAIDFEFSLNDGVFNPERQLDIIHAFYDYLRMELESKGWRFNDK